MTNRSTIPDPRSELRSPQAIILAAGKGKRMGGDLPKVVHAVADRPLVEWVVRACQAAGVCRCIVVIGHRGEMVRQALSGLTGAASGLAIEFAQQTEQLGTGHATRMAEPFFAGQPACDVFVLAGDAPLIRRQTLARLLEVHQRTHAAATLATAVLDDPTGYGRIIRNAAGQFSAIVEQKDCTPAQMAVQEINPSYYCFRSDKLFAALAGVRNHNAQQEYYLTDVPGLLAANGDPVTLVDAVPAQDVLGINTPQELAKVDAILRQRLAREGAPARG